MTIQSLLFIDVLLVTLDSHRIWIELNHFVYIFDLKFRELFYQEIVTGMSHIISDLPLNGVNFVSEQNILFLSSNQAEIFHYLSDTKRISWNQSEYTAHVRQLLNFWYFSNTLSLSMEILIQFDDNFFPCTTSDGYVCLPSVNASETI